MTEIIGSSKVLKVYPSFILGFCKCGCGGEFPLRSKSRGELRTYIVGHNGKMENNYFWQGGVTVREGKYLAVKKHGHPNADAQGYIRLHRLIMVEYIGRPLKENEEVHHKDGNTFNNDLSNLELLDHNVHSSISATKDHGDRNCLECGTDKTYMKKDNRTGKYYPWWYELGNNKWLCRNCGRRRKYKEDKKKG
jgi:hypothetical protein